MVFYPLHPTGSSCDFLGALSVRRVPVRAPAGSFIKISALNQVLHGGVGAYFARHVTGGGGGGFLSVPGRPQVTFLLKSRLVWPAGANELGLPLTLGVQPCGFELSLRPAVLP